MTGKTEELVRKPVSDRAVQAAFHHLLDTIKHCDGYDGQAGELCMDPVTMTTFRQIEQNNMRYDPASGGVTWGPFRIIIVHAPREGCYVDNVPGPLDVVVDPFAMYIKYIKANGRVKYHDHKATDRGFL